MEVGPVSAHINNSIECVMYAASIVMSSVMDTPPWFILKGFCLCSSAVLRLNWFMSITHAAAPQCRSYDGIQSRKLFIYVSTSRQCVDGVQRNSCIFHESGTNKHCQNKSEEDVERKHGMSSTYTIMLFFFIEVMPRKDIKFGVLHVVKS